MRLTRLCSNRGVQQAKVDAELTIAGINACLAFKIMVPSAVSMAPGLIRGALKIKTLVPQSSLPGIFILMLPWLFCPLVWAVYNLVFQLVGDVVLLLGLLILACQCNLEVRRAA